MPAVRRELVELAERDVVPAAGKPERPGSLPRSDPWERLEIDERLLDRPMLERSMRPSRVRPVGGLEVFGKVAEALRPGPDEVGARERRAITQSCRDAATPAVTHHDDRRHTELEDGVLEGGARRVAARVRR